MPEQNRKFKGVWIPREVWLDNKMSLIEKALLVEIDSLDNENGCTAGNAYFAKFFQIGARQVRRYTARLEELGWIKIDLIGRNRRCVRVLDKYILLVDNLKPLMDINVRRDGHKRPSADGHKRPHNNTDLNNTNNNRKNYLKLREGFGKKSKISV